MVDQGKTDSVDMSIHYCQVSDVRYAKKHCTSCGHGHSKCISDVYAVDAS